jgi:hypothetical protein
VIYCAPPLPSTGKGRRGPRCPREVIPSQLFILDTRCEYTSRGLILFTPFPTSTFSPLSSLLLSPGNSTVRALSPAISFLPSS